MLCSKTARIGAERQKTEDRKQRTEQSKSGVGQRTDGRKQRTEQSKSGVGNATSVASKQRGRKSENRGAEDREAENRERAALVMRLQSHLNR